MVIGVPLLIFILGLSIIFVFGPMVLRVGSWVVKGFQPSQPQAGE
jgi:hypothetical protein